jgi:hypothetical protein
MLEVFHRYWAKRGYDLVADVYDHGHQFEMLVKKAGVSLDDVMPGVDSWATRCKMSNAPIPTMDEILVCHHRLLHHFPEGADNG